MKLSEAIRDGARFKDMHGQTLWVGTCEGDVCGCVIGTSLYVAGEKKVGVGYMYALMEKHFPIALKLTECPVIGCDGYSLWYPIDTDIAGRTIEHLYEHHNWSKKAIAEWVEVIENKLAGDKQEGVTVGKTTPPACAFKEPEVQEVYPVVSTIA